MINDCLSEYIIKKLFTNFLIHNKLRLNKLDYTIIFYY